MTKIPNPISYDKTIVLYAASRTLERSAFYGMRSILGIYMVNDILAFSQADTMQLYGWFVQSILAAGVIGALFGDFVFGNRKALLLGTILMCIGLFLLCVPVKEVFYGAIGLFVIGSGLYTPNLLARFGKQFYTKPELADGGFTILYVLVNIGAFIGVTLVSYAGYENYMVGFALCGTLMLGSLILSFLNKETTSDKTTIVTSSETTYNVLIVVATILGVGLFWYLYEVWYTGINYIQIQIMSLEGDLNSIVWPTLSTGLSIGIGVVVAVIYSFYTFSRALKLAIAFFLTAFALVVAYLIAIPVSKSAAGMMLLVLFLLSIAEMVMAPVLYGVIVKRTNPKFLALIISLSFIPSAVLISMMYYYAHGANFQEETTTLIIAAPLVTAMGIVAFAVWMVHRKQRVNSANYR